MTSQRLLSVTFASMWITLAVIFGIGVSWVGNVTIDFLSDHYDDHHPVEAMESSIVSKQEDSIVVKMVGQRLRDCYKVRMDAYSVTQEGRRLLIYIRSLEANDIGLDVPRGKYDYGFWKVWPTRDTQRVQIDSTYVCGKRTVVSRVADLSLVNIVEQKNGG